MSKRKEMPLIAEHLISIFTRNWTETFLLDSYTDREVSYEIFFSRVLDYKEKLEYLGVKENDVICLVMNNSVELATLYFTALIMRITVIPIDPQRGKDVIKEILSLVKYHLVIYHGVELDFIEKKISLDKVMNNSEKRSTIKELEIFMKVDYHKLFLITFTSGTTGTPKGVMHSFANLYKSAIAFGSKFGFSKMNTFYHNLPMTYMAGILNLIILPLLFESKIVIGRRFSAIEIASFWEIPIKYSANTFWFVPTMIALLNRLDRGNAGKDYARGRKLIGCVGTAPLRSHTKLEFEKKYSIPLFESYGLSETLFVTTNYLNRDLVDSTGESLEGVRITIRDDGEIAVNTPWMLLGYANTNVDEFLLTIDSDRYYLTGDLGIINESGFLLVTGRKKDLIIKGGINVSPLRIEELINHQHIFLESVILGIPDEYVGEKIICFFVPNEHTNQAEIKKLNIRIIEQLGKDYRVDKFVEVQDIPHNVNGKIDKQALRELYNTREECDNRN